MQCIPSDDEMEEDDDNNKLVPDYVCYVITSEDDAMVSHCSEVMDTSITISDGSPQFDAVPQQTSTLDMVPTMSASTPVIPETPESHATTSNVRKVFKKPKKPRTPLPTIEKTGPEVVPSTGGFTGGALQNIDKDSTEFKNIVWHKKSMQFHVNEIAFREKTDLPLKVKNLQTPLDFFSYFFTNDFVENIVLETNQAALAENINTEFKIDAAQIYRYFGISMFMSIFRYPNIQSYWGEFGFRHIPDSMTWNKFNEIKKHLSFRDESKHIAKGQPGYDPIFRIRKVAEHFNERFDSIPKNARLCVDEQMCSTKMIHHLRQYLPDKPHPWGVKLFVLCDRSGYSYRFEIYTGAVNDDIILPGTPNIGSTGNVVIRLSQTVPQFVNHIIYFDNFYTSLPLLVYLRARGIFSLGTLRSSRIL